MSADFSEWDSYQICDVGKIITGKTPPGTEDKYFDGPTLFVTPTDMGDFREIKETQRTLSTDGENVLQRIMFERGIVVSCIGWQMGKSAIINRKAATNQQINTVIPDEEKVDFDFLYYVLSSKRKEIFDLGSTCTRTPILKKSAFEKISFRAPEIEKQKVVAGILCSIDEKIELNRQIIKTLEEMAQAIFKSWFVDFEPVKAKIEVKANGQDPERAAICAISGKTAAELDNLPPDQLAQLRTTAALFPDELTDSELGPIPKGWEVRFLRDVTEIVYGKNLPTKKLLQDGYPVFGGNGVIGYYNEYLYDLPRVLIACRGAASGKVLRSLPKSYVTNNSLVIDHDKKGYLTSYYLQPCLELCNLVDLTSGSAQPQMTIANMNPVQIIIPSKIVIASHSSMVTPIFEQILSLDMQNFILAKLRDTLLPKLLSGEIELGSSPISS